MKCFKSIVALCLFVAINFSLQAQALDIDHNFKSLNPKALGFSYYTIDNQGTPSASKPVQHNHVALGIVNKQVVLEGNLSFVGDVATRSVLEIYNSTLDNGVFQIFEDGSLIDSVVFGDRYPFKERSFKHRNFVFPFTLEPGKQYNFKIILEPQIDAVYVPFRIVKEMLFFKNSTRSYLLLGGIFGMYFIYLVFIVALLIVAKRTLFLYYAIVGFFLLLFSVFDTGFGMQLIWPFAPFMQDLVIAISGFGYIVGLVLFGRVFFSTKIKYPKFDKILTGFIIFAIIAFIAIFLLYFVFNAPIIVPLLALNFIYIAFGLAITALGIITYWQAGRREGFWFLTLFFSQLLMWTLLLNQRGYFGGFLFSPDSLFYNFFSLKVASPHYLLLNFLLEVLIVSSIIAFRFQNNLDEYNLTQKRIEVANENSITAFIHGQEVERTILAETLESKLGRDLLLLQRDLNKSKAFAENDEEMNNIIQQLKEVQNDLSEIASDFVQDWSTTKLETVIAKVVQQLSSVIEADKIDFHFNKMIDDFDWSDLTKLNIYRITQEICNNIIKHAKADAVVMSYELKDQLIIHIADNGVGVDEANLQQAKGIGLRNIETRVRALKGQLQIQNNNGTTVQITIPIKANLKT